MPIPDGRSLNIIDGSQVENTGGQLVSFQSDAMFRSDGGDYDARRAWDTSLLSGEQGNPIARGNLATARSRLDSMRLRQRRNESPEQGWDGQQSPIMDFVSVKERSATPPLGHGAVFGSQKIKHAESETQRAWPIGIASPKPAWAINYNVSAAPAPGFVFAADWAARICEPRP